MMPTQIYINKKGSMSAWKNYSFYSHWFKRAFLLFQAIHPHTIIWDHNIFLSATCNWKIYYDQVITEKPCYKKRYSPMWHYCQCATTANMPYHKMHVFAMMILCQYWHDLPCFLHFIWAIYTKYEWSVISWFSFICGKPSNNVSHHNIVMYSHRVQTQLCYSLKTITKHLSEEEHYVRREFKPSYFSEYVCIKYTFSAHYDIQVIKSS